MLRGQAGLPASGRRWDGARREPWAPGVEHWGRERGSLCLGLGSTQLCLMWEMWRGAGGGIGNLNQLELSHCVYTSCRWQPDSVLYLGLVLCRSFLPLPRWWQHSDKIQDPGWFLASLPEQVAFCFYFLLRCKASLPLRCKQEGLLPFLAEIKAFAS